MSYDYGSESETSIQTFKQTIIVGDPFSLNSRRKSKLEWIEELQREALEKKIRTE